MTQSLNGGFRLEYIKELTTLGCSCFYPCGSYIDFILDGKWDKVCLIKGSPSFADQIKEIREQRLRLEQREKEKELEDKMYLHGLKYGTKMKASSMLANNVCNVFK